jgi:mono/diheme cytochrome c family protein
MRTFILKSMAAAGTVAMLAAPVAAGAETPLERGTYLMKSVVACGNCHTAPGGPMAAHELAGGLPMKEGPIDAITPNLTPDKETGIGTWTDAQLMVGIRDGKRPDGSLIGPPMPFDMYRGLSDNDTKAIIAYLRTLKPVKHATRKSVYQMPLPPAYGPPVGSIPDVDRSNKVAYGAYLAGPLGHCMECHTPMGKQPGRRDYENMMGAGGFTFTGPWGESVAANLTPDKETGIGNWTDAQIKDAITKGVRPDGTKLRPPMAFAYYKNIKAEDLDAIVAYLRSLKPIKHAVR